MSDDQDIVPEPIVIGGRTFRPAVTTTFAQDIHIMGVVKDSGVAELAKRFDPGAAEVMDAVAAEIILTAHRSGTLFKLVAATLVEDGVEWSEEEAAANAEFFAGLRDRKDKDALRGSIVATILGFFVSGLLSSVSSLPSSESPTRRKDLPIDGQPEDTLTSASGTASSVS